MESFVSYPKNGFSGSNLLHDDIKNLDSTKHYSLIAQVERGLVFKVVLINKSDTLPTSISDPDGHRWVAREDLNTGWFFEDYDINTHSQTFYSEGPETPHVRLGFVGCGKMEVEVYENGGNKLTSSKNVSWESFCNN